MKYLSNPIGLSNTVCFILSQFIVRIDGKVADAFVIGSAKDQHLHIVAKGNEYARHADL